MVNNDIDLNRFLHRINWEYSGPTHRDASIENTFKKIYSLYKLKGAEKKETRKGNKIHYKPVDPFHEELKHTYIIRYYNISGDYGYECAVNLLYPTDELLEVFANVPTVKFVDIDYYNSIVDDRTLLKDFLERIGVNTSVRFYERVIQEKEATKRRLPNSHSTYGHKWTETAITGCSEMMNIILEYGDREMSVKLWNMLRELRPNKIKAIFSFTGTHEYYYYCTRREYFEALDKNRLQNEKWLLDYQGNFCSPKELKVSDLSDVYELKWAEALIQTLGIEKSLFTREQARLIRYGSALEEAGIAEEELSDFILLYKQMKEWMRMTDYDKKNDRTENGTKIF